MIRLNFLPSFLDESFAHMVRHDGPLGDKMTQVRSRPFVPRPWRMWCYSHNPIFGQNNYVVDMLPHFLEMPIEPHLFLSRWLVYLGQCEGCGRWYYDCFSLLRGETLPLTREESLGPVPRG